MFNFITNTLIVIRLEEKVDFLKKYNYNNEININLNKFIWSKYKLIQCDVLNQWPDLNYIEYSDSEDEDIHDLPDEEFNSTRFYTRPFYMSPTGVIFMYTQKSFKNYFINILLNNYKTLTFLSKNKIKDEDKKYTIDLILHLIYLYIPDSCVWFVIKSNHINHKKTLYDLIGEIITKAGIYIKYNNTYIIFKKPNFFYINLQYKKIKSIKKSRKKLLYRSSTR